MHKKKIIGIVLGCLILILLGMRSCHRNSTPERSPISVAIAVAHLKNVTVYATAIGNVQAYSTVNVKSQVNGTLLSVGFKEGDTVSVNQLLFNIDPRSYQIMLDQAQANLQRDQALLLTAQSAVTRNEPLLKKGYVSRQDYDSLRNTAQSLMATVAADKSAVDNAALKLSHCKIYAPIQGRTGNLLVKPGNLVKENDTDPLVIINQVMPIYVSFNLSEDRLMNIRREEARHAVTVLISPNKNKETYTENGELTFIDNTVDVSTGTIQLKATVSNKGMRLWPGQFVKVKIPTYVLQNALLVPTTAIQAGPNGTYVYIVDKTNHVATQAVKLGPGIDGSIVIKAGLQPGMRVVTAGQMLLTEGALVQPSESAP